MNCHGCHRSVCDGCGVTRHGGDEWYRVQRFDGEGRYNAGVSLGYVAQLCADCWKGPREVQRRGSTMLCRACDAPGRRGYAADIDVPVTRKATSAPGAAST